MVKRFDSWKYNIKFSYYTFPLFVAGNDGKILVKMIDSLYLPNYKFQANNITTWISNSGIYNHDSYIYGGGYMPGFEWRIRVKQTCDLHFWI